jgi:hypothetical protein
MRYTLTLIYNNGLVILFLYVDLSFYMLLLTYLLNLCPFQHFHSEQRNSISKSGILNVNLYLLGGFYFTLLFYVRSLNDNLN